MKKPIDYSSPEAFMGSLEDRAKAIGDQDFRSAHDPTTVGNKGDVPISGNWGGVIRCIGVARVDGVVAIRNTNDPKKVTALFDEQEWRSFLAAAKAGHFD